MVISIASQKGGTGKTSTSISLAAGLAHKGKKVLLIDMDSQAKSSKVLLREYPKILKEQTIYTTILERQPLVVHPTHVKNLSIVPAHILVSNIPSRCKRATWPISDAPMSVKAPKRKKVGRSELLGSGRPRGPRTALGTAGSPSCSCPRQCAWLCTLGCVRTSSF